MDDEPKAPVAGEQPLEMTDAEQGAENVAPDSTSEPNLTLLEALKQGADTWKQWRAAHPRKEDTPDLSGMDLTDLHLQGADLRQVNLRGTTLSGVDLSGANLQGADLHGTRMIGECNLTGASFQDADLRISDLSGTTGFQAGQLGGADLTGATLPEGSEGYDDLTHVEEASRNARKLFLSMLLVCAYCLLTVATTRDAALVTNSGTSPLPIIQSQIPIVEFYMATPVLLLGFYIYFHLYSQRLWESLGGLPAVFPNGRQLDKAVYPWLLNSLVTAHRPRLSDRRPPFFGLQYWASVLAAWGVVPVTLLGLWLRYLNRQHPDGSSWLAVLLLLSVGLGLSFYLVARATLGGQQSIPRARPLRKLHWVAVVVGYLLLLVLFQFSWFIGERPFVDALEDVFQTPPSVRLALVALVPFAAWWGLRRMAGATLRTGHWAALAGVYVLLFYASLEAGRGALPGFSLSANFVGQDVSTKPSGWDGVNLSLVKRARLDGRNLRNLKARGAFLAKADLSGANLTGADLFHRPPMLFVEAGLEVRFKTHEDEVADQVGLAQFLAGRVHALEDELRVVLIAAECDVHDHQLGEATADRGEIAFLFGKQIGEEVEVLRDAQRRFLGLLGVLDNGLERGIIGLREQQLEVAVVAFERVAQVIVTQFRGGKTVHGLGVVKGSR